MPYITEPALQLRFRPTFKYKIFRKTYKDDESTLNALGLEGWEAVTMCKYDVLLKRQIGFMAVLPPDLPPDLPSHPDPFPVDELPRVCTRTINEDHICGVVGPCNGWPRVVRFPDTRPSPPTGSAEAVAEAAGRISMKAAKAANNG